MIDRWHQEHGWLRIGYHYVIQNCFPTMESFRAGIPDLTADGTIETGRPEDEAGAHARNYNASSIGICLIGVKQFTHAQLTALARLVGELKGRYPGVKVVGHYEITENRTCPNIDMGWLRRFLIDN